MPDPQLEDGYARIANELLDKIISFPFSKRQYKVVFYIIRQTYGYNKKTDSLSYGKISKGTGLHRRHVIETVSELVSMEVIKVGRSGKYMHGGELNSMGLNKRYSEWKTSAETVTSPETALVPKQTKTSDQNSTKLVTKTVTHKRHKNKQKTGSAHQWKGGDNIPPEWITEAAEKYGDDVDWEAEGFRFVDKHLAKGSKFKDWKRAWWSWCRTPYPKTPNERKARRLAV